MGEKRRGSSSKKCLVKREEKEEDRISSLPDCLIQNILSFLPSTKEVVKTHILSKRWQFQWTYVPNLIFESNKPITEQELKSFLKFVNNTLVLNSCSKIKKFVFRPISYTQGVFDSQLSLYILFAIRKEAEMINLHLTNPLGHHSLPECFYNNASVTEMNMVGCTFKPKGNVNWTSLRILSIVCSYLTEEAIENITSGSPLLESLVFHYCRRFSRYDIASKSLKRLVLYECPPSGGELLKISGPSLVQLEILGYPRFTEVGAVNLPSLISATLDFRLPSLRDEDYYTNLFVGLLEQVHPREDLKIGAFFLQVLSTMEVKGVACPILNSKFLTVHAPCFSKDFPGIALLIRSLPGLEKLKVILENGKSFRVANFPEIEDFEDLAMQYWMSYEKTPNPLSHLKTIEIIGLDANYHGYEQVLNFAEFLQKNATVLEKIVIVEHAHRSDFAHKVSQKMSL